MKLPLTTSSPTGLGYVFLGMMLLVLIACGEETPPAASQEPTVTTVPATQVVAPTPTSVAAPTPTTTPLRAPTATVVPTDTPAPTDMPVTTDAPAPTATLAPPPTATPRPEPTLAPWERERAALKDFYEATDGDNWANNAGWLSDVPVGEWHGVTVDDDGRVTQLRLRENNLGGHIPSGLGSLADLTLLDLQVNELTGTIPRELGNLSRLEGLDLDRNQLVGQIPAELANLSGLQTLDLDFNQLEGPMPAWLGNLTNLWFLSLGENPMDGPIPPELGNLTNLRILGLVDAHLHGNIPVELGNLTNLTVLFLSTNELTGTIPSQLGSLTNLERLFLAGNDLEGCVPAGLMHVPENDLDELRLPGCAAPPELSAVQLGELFDEIIRKTEQREAFSEIKESNVGFSALEDMKKLRSEFSRAETEAELYYALWKLSNARRDAHLRVGPVDGGLQIPEEAPCVSAPIHALPDYSDIHNPTFFVAAVGSGLTTPKLGDTIVGVNGQSSAQYVEEFTPWIRHSTLPGLYWHMAHQFPRKVPNVPPRLYSERLNLTLERSTGERYDVALPYRDGCRSLRFVGSYPGFIQVMNRESFNVLIDRSRRIMLLQWRGFDTDELTKDIPALLEYAEREEILDYARIIDVSLSGGGSGGAYAIQRLVDQPFRPTFGNVRLSDLGKARIQRYVNREPMADTPDIFGLNLSRSWLYDWARTDATAAIRRGDEYTPPVPFKLAHLPKDSDGILQPAPLHFSGPVAIINGGVWGGSHLDQFVAMLVDNDLAVFVGMPTGGFSNTWEGDEVLRFPFTRRPVVSFQWSIGHTIRPNGEILEGNPAQPDIYIPLTRQNFQEYHQTLLDTATTALSR